MQTKDLPGLATPWPHRVKFANTRRLLAMWRWEWERGQDDSAAVNARASVLEHTAKVREEGGEGIFDE